MKIKFLGQSAFLIDFNGSNLLVDPMISPNPLAKDVDIDTLDVDYILLTHGHEDHVADAETIAKRTGAKIISNYEIVTWYAEKGIEGHPMNLGGKWKFDFGTIKYVHAVHSSMLPDRSYGGPSGGFVIWNDNQCLYIAGDTALTLDMKLLPMTCPSIDVAIFPIGDNFTMGYEDAIIASDFVACDKIIPCHYDTFGYIKVDHDQVKSAFKEKGKDLIFIDINEEREFN